MAGAVAFVHLFYDGSGRIAASRARGEIISEDD
jgi:hypothetical protein